MFALEQHQTGIYVWNHMVLLTFILILDTYHFNFPSFFSQIDCTQHKNLFRLSEREKTMIFSLLLCAKFWAIYLLMLPQISLTATHFTDKKSEYQNLKGGINSSAFSVRVFNFLSKQIILKYAVQTFFPCCWNCVIWTVSAGASPMCWVISTVSEPSSLEFTACTVFHRS